MDAELPLDDRRVEPKVGSKEWRNREWRRFRRAFLEYEGVFAPYVAAVRLGVSRQRVHQLMEEGVLEKVEFFQHPFVRGDQLEVLQSMEKERRRPGFRYSESTA